MNSVRAVDAAGRARQAMTLSNGLEWLLDDVAQLVPHVRHALVLSNDELATGASGYLDRSSAEDLATVSSWFHSLAKGAGRQDGQRTADHDRVRRRFVTAADGGSCLSVLSGMETDWAGSRRR